MDQTLHTTRVHQDLPVVMTRPPGIENLAQWGQLVTPSGKHMGLTFAQIYERENSYVQQMWNRRAVSSWVRSFQLYCRHRREASRERLLSSQQMPVVPKMAAKAMCAPKSMVMPAMPTDGEWIHVQAPVDEKQMKRGRATESNAMVTNPNPDRVNQLQAQIAILQRDLQVEMHGKSQEPNEQ